MSRRRQKARQPGAGHHGPEPDVLFRQMYYENDLLFSGNLQIRNPHAIAGDSMGRVAYVHANDIDIRITHAGDEPAQDR